MAKVIGLIAGAIIVAIIALDVAIEHGWNPLM